ncbi:hypothetical protein ABID42_004031 [Arcicella rosea]
MDKTEENSFLNETVTYSSTSVRDLHTIPF